MNVGNSHTPWREYALPSLQRHLAESDDPLLEIQLCQLQDAEPRFLYYLIYSRSRRVQRAAARHLNFGVKNLMRLIAHADEPETVLACILNERTTLQVFESGLERLKEMEVAEDQVELLRGKLEATIRERDSKLDAARAKVGWCNTSAAESPSDERLVADKAGVPAGRWRETDEAALRQVEEARAEQTRRYESMGAVGGSRQPAVAPTSGRRGTRLFKFQLRDYAANGVTDSGVAMRWASIGVSAWFVSDYLSAGITSPNDAEAWIAHGFTVREALAYAKAGIVDPDIAADLFAGGTTGRQALKSMQSGQRVA